MKKLAILLSCCLFLLTACTQKYNYPRVNESFSIINLTDTTFVVEFGFLHVDTIIVKDSVRKQMNVCRYIEKPSSTDNDMWLNENAFSDYSETLKIYKIENGDTLFVQPSYYINRDKWSSEMEKYYDMGVFIFINHSLEIKPEMFEQ